MVFFRHGLIAAFLVVFSLVATATLPRGYYLQATVNPATTKIGKTQVWHMDPIVKNRYVSLSRSKSVIDWDVSGGYGFLWHQRMIVQLGLLFAHFGNYKLQGHVQEDADPNQENLAYKYYVKSNRLLLDTKLLFAVNQKFLPYLNLGMGCAWNKAYNYSEWTIRHKTLPGAFFDDKANADFAWQLGFGVIIKPLNHLALLLGYRYVSLGKAKLGTIPDQTSNDHITTNRMHANELQLGLIYFFNKKNNVIGTWP